MAKLQGKSFNVRHYTQIFLPNTFPAMFVGTIDLCSLKTLSTILTLPESHKFNRKQNQLVVFFLHISQLIRIKFNVVLKQFRMNILTLLFG